MRFKILIAAVLTLTSQVLAFAAEPQFQPGETVLFAIKKFGVRVGEASLVYKGPVSFSHGQALLAVFTATSMNFFDKEEIYFDPQTFLPVFVKRDLNIWGQKEQITESYVPGGKVIIKKESRGQVTQSTIEKKTALDNIYCFMYRYRKEGDFRVGNKVSMHLPTGDVSLKILKKETIQAGGQRHDAFYMQSDSGEFRLWFDAGPHKIPLRIDGAIGLGSASLITTGYKP